jgi:hypothetical protein
MTQRLSLLKGFIPGRIRSGYEKLEIYAFSNFDCYIIRLKEKAYIPNHRDFIPNKNHFRVNIVLKKAEVGGLFVCDEGYSILDRIFLFRPDVSEHSVTEVVSGTRYVLSFGLAISNNIIKR